MVKQDIQLPDPLKLIKLTKNLELDLKKIENYLKLFEN